MALWSFRRPREPDHASKSPRDAGVFGESPLVAITRDRVVVDAFQIEPVSTPNFPANREFNREFAKSGADERPCLSNRRARSIVCSSNSLRKETGIFRWDNMECG